MRWFKHMVASADDEKLSRLTDVYGLEGYGFWWRVVEIVAEKVGPDGETSVEFSAKKWGNLAGISPKKFRTLAECCANLGLFTFECSGNSENIIKINMPNILKYRDEYSRKSGQSADKVRTRSGPSRARVPEADTETEANTDNTQRITGNVESSPDPLPDKSVNSDFSDTPGIEFQELRAFYDEHCRAEAPLTGFIEYKQLRASRRWPGINRICDAIDKHGKADPVGWKSFCPGLVKFLREHWWEKKPTARASPPGKSDAGMSQDAAFETALARREARRNHAQQ